MYLCCLFLPFNLLLTYFIKRTKCCSIEYLSLSFFFLLDQKDGGGLKIGILFLGSKESILPSHNTCLKHYCFHHSREKK